MRTGFVFDLDGTITRSELLPLIARDLGLEAEIELLTRLTLAGTIPFEESFRLRFAILKASPISRVQACVRNVDLDDQIIEFIRRNADASFVLTGNLDVWIEPLVKRLGCLAYASRATSDGEHVSKLVKVMQKGEAVVELRERFDRIVAVGDSANDVPMFDAADLGIAFGGVHKPADVLLEVADYVVFDSGALCRLLSAL
jgi:phosphoserine phosphatase